MSAPLITIAQMREWENATWASGQKQDEVIRLAGQAVARKAQHLTRPGDRIVVLAGSGHNGDDARQAGQFCPGREVRVLNLRDPEAELGSLREHLEVQPALIIDGLFGIGLNRPLNPAWIRVIEEIAGSRAPILAVDVPSGLHADTGEPLGAAVRASVTLTLGSPKRGLVSAQAAPYVGRLEVAAQIGLIPNPHRSDLEWTLAEDFTGFPPVRPVDSHKGTFGHLAILAGSLGYHGAAVLAARGALRAQPGLVTVITQSDVYGPVASQLQSAMVHPWSEGMTLPGSTTAVLVGPGLAAYTLRATFKAWVRQLWEESPLPVIVDASALDWLPETGGSSAGFRLLTPHPGEGARLLQTTAAHIQADRPTALRALSRGWRHCWVVLKGHQTLIGRDEGSLGINSTGNPGLAQGGSGDSLAGYLAGLLAQPALLAEPIQTLRYGVWQHGAAADRLQDRHRNWTVEELLAGLGSVSRTDGFCFL